MSSLTVLNHEIHQVDNLYCLNDLHKASGGLEKHRPTFFLRNQETKDLVAEIIDEKLSSANLQNGKNPDVQIRTSVENSVLRVVKGNFGKAKQGAFACKEIVYRYAMWISPKFALAVIRVFDAFVTGKLEPKAKPKTTTSDRVPLKDAVNVLVAKSALNYSDAYKMVHQFMCVDSINQIPLDDLPKAVAYVHSLTLVAHNPQPQTPTDKELYEILFGAVSSHHQLYRMTRNLANTLHVRDTIDYQLKDLKEQIVKAIKFAENQNLHNLLGKPLVDHNAQIHAWHGASWSIALG